MVRVVLLVFVVFGCAQKEQPKEQLDVVGKYRNGKDGRIFITKSGDDLMFQFIRWNGPQKLTPITDSSYIIGTSTNKVQFKKLSDGQIDLVIFDDPKHSGSHLKQTTMRWSPTNIFSQATMRKR